MGADTDHEQLSRRRMGDLRHLDQDYDRRYDRGNSSGGSSKFTNFMLSVIVLLLAAAISGQIWFNNTTAAEIATIRAEITSLQATLNYLIDGRFRPSIGNDRSGGTAR